MSHQSTIDKINAVESEATDINIISHGSTFVPHSPSYFRTHLMQATINTIVKAQPLKAVVCKELSLGDRNIRLDRLGIYQTEVKVVGVALI